MNLYNKITIFALLSITISDIKASWGKYTNRLLTPALTVCMTNYFNKKNNLVAHCSAAPSSNSSDAQTSTSDLNNNPTEPVFSEELADKWLNKIDWRKANNAADIFEKRQLFEDVVAVVTGKQIRVKENTEDNFFKLVYPEKIEENIIFDSTQSKHEKVMEILKKEYKGPIPMQIDNLATYFAYYEECLANKVSIQNRLLLHGQPGTGKSYLIEALSKALQIPYFSASAASFGDKYIGESSRKIRKAFETVKDFNKPVLFFIDEIDAIATKRKGSTHSENRATLTTLLVELQNLQKVPHVFVLVATNDKDSLDKAVIDRFSSSICEIKPLSKDDKEELLEKLCKEHNINNYEGYPKALARVLQADHFSNRDLVSIVKTAKLMQFFACKKNPSKCHEPMHKYFREAIESTEKDASFWWRGSFGSGI